MRGITPHGKAGTQVLRPDGRRKEERHAREKKNIYQRKDRKKERWIKIVTQAGMSIWR